MFSLSEKVAFVTGAASGLGQAITIAMARSGARLVITDKSIESLQQTDRLLQSEHAVFLKLAMDVRDVEQVGASVAHAEQAMGAIDVLINNAGINRPAPGLEVTLDLWEDHFNTNVRGAFFAAQAVAPGMIRRRWGRIIFISSQSGVIGIPGQPVYCATKGAVIQLVRTLGLEWAKHGITVNSIAPTFVETGMTRERLKNPEFLRFVLRKIPAGRLATPEEIGAAAVYLASDEAAMVNCETHLVDGGWTAW